VSKRNPAALAREKKIFDATECHEVPFAFRPYHSMLFRIAFALFIYELVIKFR
jgi:hypothetical protein